MLALAPASHAATPKVGVGHSKVKYTPVTVKSKPRVGTFSRGVRGVTNSRYAPIRTKTVKSTFRAPDTKFSTRAKAKPVVFKSSGTRSTAFAAARANFKPNKRVVFVRGATSSPIRR